MCLYSPPACFASVKSAILKKEETVSSLRKQHEVTGLFHSLLASAILSWPLLFSPGLCYSLLAFSSLS